jgi:hypothetical protein
MTPDLVATFITTFQEELARLQRRCGRTQARLKDQFASVGASSRVCCAPPRTAPGMTACSSASTSWRHSRRPCGSNYRRPPALPRSYGCTNAAALYAAKVADLQAALNEPDIRREAMAALQTLIERIVLTPDERAPNRLGIDRPALTGPPILVARPIIPIRTSCGLDSSSAQPADLDSAGRPRASIGAYRSRTNADDRLPADPLGRV